MPYFDLTNQGALLRTATRSHEDIELIAEQAEYDLLDFYRERGVDTLNTPLEGSSPIRTGLENLTVDSAAPRVMLAFYKADPDDLTTADELQFLADVRRSIAALIEERVAQYDREPGVKSERRGRRSVEFFSDSAPGSGVSKSVRRYVSKYDIRQPV